MSDWVSLTILSTSSAYYIKAQWTLLYYDIVIIILLLTTLNSNYLLYLCTLVVAPGHYSNSLYSVYYFSIKSFIK